MSVSAVSFAGDIQIFCPPDLRIYLDDEVMDTSSAEEDGLFLMNVPIGTRRIWVEKDGFVPQSIQVEVSNFPIVVSIRGRDLFTKVLIKDETRTVLEVSFMKGDEPFVVSYVLH